VAFTGAITLLVLVDHREIQAIGGMSGMANKQTVAIIALSAGWILAADTADATTYEDIAGQWCGDVTDYVFTPDTLSVKFSRRQTGQCVQDHEIHLHQRQRTY
jgi:hypothetical protein